MVPMVNPRDAYTPLTTSFFLLRSDQTQARGYLNEVKAFAFPFIRRFSGAGFSARVESAARSCLLLSEL